MYLQAAHLKGELPQFLLISLREGEAFKLMRRVSEVVLQLVFLRLQLLQGCANVFPDI